MIHSLKQCLAHRCLINIYWVNIWISSSCVNFSMAETSWKGRKISWFTPKRIHLNQQAYLPFLRLLPIQGDWNKPRIHTLIWLSNYFIGKSVFSTKFQTLLMESCSIGAGKDLFLQESFADKQCVQRNWVTYWGSRSPDPVFFFNHIWFSLSTVPVTVISRCHIAFKHLIADSHWKLAWATMWLYVWLEILQFLLLKFICNGKGPCERIFPSTQCTFLSFSVSRSWTIFQCDYVSSSV